MHYLFKCKFIFIQNILQLVFFLYQYEPIGNTVGHQNGRIQPWSMSHMDHFYATYDVFCAFWSFDSPWSQSAFFFILFFYLFLTTKQQLRHFVKHLILCIMHFLIICEIIIMYCVCVFQNSKDGMKKSQSRSFISNLKHKVRIKTIFFCLSLSLFLSFSFSIFSVSAAEKGLSCFLSSLCVCILKCYTNVYFLLPRGREI